MAGMSFPNNEFKLTFDDETLENLEAYALKHHKMPRGKGNRSEAVRRILEEVFKLENLPLVQEVLDADMELDGDILLFLRRAVSQWMKSEVDTSADFDLA